MREGGKERGERKGEGREGGRRHMGVNRKDSTEG